MSGFSATLPVTEAARRLGVSGQEVRNRLRSGELVGRKEGKRWIVDAQSVEDAAASLPESSRPVPRTGDLEARLDRLTAAVEQLTQREATSVQLVEALQRERDRFRAEAAASKEAALRVNSAARETDQAVRQLLDVLALQSDALTQLLAPSSPEDLLR